MNAGRELDTLVADRVMGWKTFASEVGYGRPPHKGPTLVLDQVPHYSVEISAAWQVVEKMRSQWGEGDLTDHFWSFKDCGISCGGWRVEIEVCPDHDGCDAVYEATAPTLAEAICRAALAAVGYKEPARP